MFVDRAKIKLAAGKGGNGIVSWRREKYIPKGGPYGGDGGCGADIIIRVDSQIPSLDWWRNRRTIKAENGIQGGTARRRGRNGKTLLLKVPCGTLIKDGESGEVLHDLSEDGQEVVICRGGRGGRGNASFATPTRQAPTKATPGRIGESCFVELELKLIADVGLVGLPNAGKSTLVHALTDIKVKMAPYPFTTLHPKIGYIRSSSHNRILIADIPGIIAGAHQNRGLGFEFLRHIERTKLLVFVLDASGIDGRNPIDDFQTLKQEVGAYSEELLERPYIVILNKEDSFDAEENIAAFKEKVPLPEDILFTASALQKQGLEAIVASFEKLIPLSKEETLHCCSPS